MELKIKIIYYSPDIKQVKMNHLLVKKSPSDLVVTQGNRRRKKKISQAITDDNKEDEGENFPVYEDDDVDVSKKFIAEARSGKYEEIANLKTTIKSPSAVVNPVSVEIKEMTKKYGNLKTMSPGGKRMMRDNLAVMSPKQVESSVRKEFVNLFRQPTLDQSLLKSPTKLPNVRMDSSGLALDNALLQQLRKQQKQQELGKSGRYKASQSSLTPGKFANRGALSPQTQGQRLIDPYEDSMTETLSAMKGRKKSVGSSLNQKQLKARRASGQPQTTKVSAELQGPVGVMVDYEMTKIRSNLLHGNQSVNHDHRMVQSRAHHSTTVGSPMVQSRILSKNQSKAKISSQQLSEGPTNATRLASKSGVSHPDSGTNSKGSGSRKTSPSLAGAKNQSYKANFRSGSGQQDQAGITPNQENRFFHHPTPVEGAKFSPEDTSYFGPPDQQRELQAYVQQQQQFRDTHTSRTATSKEGRRAAFREYKAQMAADSRNQPSPIKHQKHASLQKPFSSIPSEASNSRNTPKPASIFRTSEKRKSNHGSALHVPTIQSNQHPSASASRSRSKTDSREDYNDNKQTEKSQKDSKSKILNRQPAQFAAQRHSNTPQKLIHSPVGVMSPGGSGQSFGGSASIQELDNEGGTYNSSQFKRHLQENTPYSKYSIPGAQPLDLASEQTPTERYQYSEQSKYSFASSLNRIKQQRHSTLGPRNIDISTNFLEHNTTAIREFKNQRVKSCQDKIEKLHSHLMSKLPLTSETSNLHAIQKTLSPQLRQFFMNNEDHAVLLQAMNNLNGNFVEIIDTVCGYRIELGQQLQKMVECYNSIYIQQFQIFYTGKLQKESALENKIQQLERERLNLVEKQGLLDEEKQHRRDLLDSKDREITQLRENQKHLEDVIAKLSKMVRKDEKQQEKIDAELKKQQADTIAEGVRMEEGFERAKRIHMNQNYEKNHESLFDPEHVPQLKKALSRAEREQEKEEAYLREVQQVLRKLMRTHSRHVRVQTEKSLWNETAQYQAHNYFSDGGDRSPSEASGNKGYGYLTDESERKEQEKRLKQEAKYEKLKSNMGVNTEEEPIPPRDSNQLVKVFEEDGADSNQQKAVSLQGRLKANRDKSVRKTVSKKRSTVHQSPKTAKGNAGLSDDPARADFESIEQPQRYYNKSLRQNGLLQGGQMQYLHEKFDELCDSIKKQNQSKHQKRNDNLNRNLQWRVPYSTIAFCANRIKELLKTQDVVATYKLLPWVKFKLLLFAIYDHRVENAHEINGLANMNYCCLNEYILVYAMDTYKEKGRAKAEELVVELLINLRYFYDQQVRAKMFAWNLELIFIKPSVVIKGQKGGEGGNEEDGNVSGTDEYGDPKVDRRGGEPPQNIYGDGQCPDNDLFAQEFFLHGYSMFSRARRAFVESKEGKTYMPLSEHDRLAKHIISQIRGPCGNITKWNYKVEQMVKTISVNGADVEFVDIDDLLYGMMNEFKNQKGAFQRSLEKEFMTVMDTFSVAAPVPFEKFKSMVENIQMGGLDSESSRVDPLVEFTSEISLVRAYVFCLTAGRENSDVFSANNFIAGLARFGVENPTPCVSSRAQLYGITSDVHTMLERAEKKWGKLKLKIHTKRYTLARPMDAIDLKGAVNQKASLLMKRKLMAKELVEENLYDMLMPKNMEVHEAGEIEGPEPKELMGQRSEMSDIRVDIHREVRRIPPKSIIGRGAERFESIGGVRFRIENVAALREEYREELAAKLRQKKIEQGLISEYDAINAEREKEKEEEGEAADDSSPTYLEDKTAGSNAGSLPDLDLTRRNELTMIQYATSHKQILIPSMGSVSKVFSEHLIVLRDLRIKIEELKQAYIQQKDQARSWDKTEQIITLLDNACNFLDLPGDHYLNKYKQIEGPDGKLVNAQEMADYQVLKAKTLKETKKAKDALKDNQKKTKGQLKALKKGDSHDDLGIQEVASDEEDSDGN